MRLNAADGLFNQFGGRDLFRAHQFGQAQSVVLVEFSKGGHKFLTPSSDKQDYKAAPTPASRADLWGRKYRANLPRRQTIGRRQK